MWCIFFFKSCHLSQIVFFFSHLTVSPVQRWILQHVPRTKTISAEITRAPEIVPIQSSHAVCCLLSIHLLFPPPRVSLLSDISQSTARKKSCCVSTPPAQFTSCFRITSSTSAIYDLIVGFRCLGWKNTYGKMCLVSVCSVGDSFISVSPRVSICILYLLSDLVITRIRHLPDCITTRLGVNSAKQKVKTRQFTYSSIHRVAKNKLQCIL